MDWSIDEKLRLSQRNLSSIGRKRVVTRFRAARSLPAPLLLEPLQPFVARWPIVSST
jgi:hypothetical protein